MKLDLTHELQGINGPIPTQSETGSKKGTLKLKEILINVLTTEKILNDQQNGFTPVNNKSEAQKMEDFKIGMKITNATKEVDLTAKEITRIIELSHYLQTNTYGALMVIIDK